MAITKVLIAGGGIGGLATAIALRNKGIHAEVFERDSAFRTSGYGIVMAPNGVKALRRLGANVSQAVQTRGRPTPSDAEYPFLTKAGKLKMKMPFGALSKTFGAPMTAIMRTDLHDILRSSLPPETLHTGKALVDFRDEGGKVTAIFQDGSEVTGDLLVGADGHGTVARTKLFGPSAPEYLGSCSIRGILNADYSAYPEGFLSMGGGKSFFVNPLPGGRYFWALGLVTPQGKSSRLSGAELKCLVLENVKGWHAPIEQMVNATDDSVIGAHELYARAVLKTWSVGRVTLLGDSAHLMSPFMGQGGAMALEDAVALADALSQHGDHTAALAAYEAKRVKRANDMTKESRMLGKMYQITNPVAQVFMDIMGAVMSKIMSPEKMYGDAFGYEP